MRFVATKAPEQQSCLTLHCTRHLFIRRQTSVINAIRAHLAEFGIVAPVGRHVRPLKITSMVTMSASEKGDQAWRLCPVGATRLKLAHPVLSEAGFPQTRAATIQLLMS